MEDLYRPIPVLDRFVPRFDIELLDLAAIEEEALLADNSALACFLNLFRAQYDEVEAFSSSLARSLAGLKAVAPDAINLEAWLRFAIRFASQRRGREERDTMIKVVKSVLGEEGPDMGETIADAWRQEGLEKGLEKGRLEGSRAILLKLIARRFPQQSADEIRQKLEAYR